MASPDTLEPDIPSPAPEDVRRELQRRGLLIVRPISGFLAVFYLLATASHWCMLPHDVALWMSVSSTLTAAALGGLYLALRRGRARPEWHGASAALIGTCVGINVLLRLGLSGDPSQTLVLMLAVVALSVLLPSLRWQAVFSALVVGAWLVIAASYGPWSAWVEFLPFMLAAAVLAMALTIVGERAVIGSVRWMLAERQRREALAAALEQTESARSELRDSQAQLQAMLDTSGAAVFSVDRDLALVRWNDMFRQLAQEIENVRPEPGLQIEAIMPSFMRERWVHHYRRALDGERIHEDVVFSDPYPDRVFEVTLGPIGTTATKILGVATFARDITPRKRIEEALRDSEVKLRHDALHDALTGLPNRAAFFEHLQASWVAAEDGTDRGFALLYLDLDRFKVVNDSLGHAVGDQLLNAIGQRLLRFVRPGDTVARFGGDEFAILLHHLRSTDEATTVAERLQSVIRQPFDVSGYEVHTSASIGIAWHERGYGGPEEMLRDADIAMYSAKAGGKARYKVFDTHMHQRVLSRLQLENELRKALENEELRLFYQPIVSLETRHLIGFEALIRWMHPDRGLLSPAEFLDLACETGLILPIGEWVLDHACHQLTRWRERFGERRPVFVSVNLSDKEVAAAALEDRIEATLDKHNLDPGSLWLEVTEDVLTDSLVNASERLGRLRGRGIRICVDDFGSGYSALSQLGRYSFDVLKIDRRFFSPHWQGGWDNVGVVQALLDLAQSLGMELVAEGLQTAEQVERLHRLGCPYGQGFYFSEPLTPQAATEFIARTPSGVFRVLTGPRSIALAPPAAGGGPR